MKEYDEFDKRIENILKADIYEPLSYTNTIKNALNKKEKRVISFPRLIAAIIAGAMLISGVVYAKQIGEFIRRIFNENKGIDTAAEYGYIDEFETEFSSKSNTKVKIKNIVIDEYDINFVLLFNFNKESKTMSSITIPDLIITDEYKNILLCKDKLKFYEFCNRYNLNYDFYECNEKYTNSCIYRSQTYNEKQISYNIKSTNPLPKSKKLFMEFNHIIVTFDDGTSNEIQDEWKIEVDVSEKFYKRTNEYYYIVESNNPQIIDVIFETHNTGTIFELNAKFEPYVIDDLAEEEKEKRTKEFIDFGSEHIKNDIYLENSKGQVFYKTNSNYADEETDYYLDGTFHYKTTLDLTKYDMTDTITLYFTTHTINGDKDFIIKLQKNKQ